MEDEQRENTIQGLREMKAILREMLRAVIQAEEELLGDDTEEYPF